MAVKRTKSIIKAAAPDNSWAKPVVRKRTKRDSDPLMAPAPRGRILWKSFGSPVGRKSIKLRGLHLVSPKQAPKHPAFKPLYGPRSLLTATDFVVDFRANRIDHMRTTTSTGTVVGWDSCGQCKLHLRHCRCPYLHIPARVTFCAFPKSVDA